MGQRQARDAALSARRPEAKHYAFTSVKRVFCAAAFVTLMRRPDRYRPRTTISPRVATDVR